MTDQIKLKSRFGLVISIIVWLIMASGFVSIFFAEKPLELLHLIFPLGFISYLVWLLYWFPLIEINTGFVRVVNPIKSWRISYPAIARIDTKFALTFFTDSKKIEVWSAPAPGRHSLLSSSKVEGQHLPESSYLDGTIRPGDFPSSDSGSAALIVRRIWEQKRDSGELSSGTKTITESYNWAQLIPLLVIALAWLLVALFS